MKCAKTLGKCVEGAFEKEAESVLQNMEPPEYLKESAQEFAGESWGQMEDEAKFDWVKSHTNIVESKSTEGSGDPSKPGSILQTVEALPGTYDPLQTGDNNKDYKRTQALARWLSVARTREVLEERGSFASPTDTTIAWADSKLWSAWKDSSTSRDGMLLQVATAEELGGRLNKKTATIIDPDRMVAYANSEFSGIGGYQGVKAYIRAKWEVTQFMLDKAGVHELKLYRGVRLEQEVVTKFFEAIRRAMESARTVGGKTYLPNSGSQTQWRGLDFDRARGGK